MKIALIAPTYLPARRANTIQVMKMAQAFTALGHFVQVLVPGAAPDPKTDWQTIAHHYGLQHTFGIEWLPIYPHLRSYDYGLLSVRQAQGWGADLIYTRLPQAAAVASFFGLPTVYEAHDLSQGQLGPWLLTRFLKGRGARALVVITVALADALVSQFSPPKALPLLVASDGVDLNRYQNLPEPAKARQFLPAALQLPSSAFTIGYTGHLYPGRGTGLILEVAARLPDITFLLVGGEPERVAQLQAQVQERALENVILAGFVPNAELPRYQAACDILLMPYQRKVSASSGGNIAKYLSPMKLFEYLACGRAILSSDLPVLQEVLNPSNAVMLPADDMATWITAIQDLRANPQKRAALAHQARKDAAQYSWEARAERILAAAAKAPTNVNHV